LRCFGSRHFAWIVNPFGRASLSKTDRRSAADIEAAARQEDKAQEKHLAISDQQPVKVKGDIEPQKKESGHCPFSLLIRHQRKR